MIRGNIEMVTQESVQGWIYTEDQKICEKLLLAFNGTQCVGSGKVSVFRSDLAKAGLGDGHLGFSFPITVPADAVGAVVIKIDGSDAVLLQSSAFVASAPSPVKVIDQGILQTQLARLKWALTRGRISQGDFDFLRILWSFGVYERGLLHRNEHGDSAVVDLPVPIAKDLFECYLGMETNISNIPSVTASNLKEHFLRVASNPKLAPVVGLTCVTRAALHVLEGSHVRGSAGANLRPSGAVHYTISPESLLIIDTRITAELSLPPGQSIDLLTASCSAV